MSSLALKKWDPVKCQVRFMIADTSLPYWIGKDLNLGFYKIALNLSNGQCCRAGAEEPKLRIAVPAPAPAPFYLSKTWRNFTEKSWLLK